MAWWGSNKDIAENLVAALKTVFCHDGVHAEQFAIAYNQWLAIKSDKDKCMLSRVRSKANAITDRKFNQINTADDCAAIKKQVDIENLRVSRQEWIEYYKEREENKGNDFDEEAGFAEFDEIDKSGDGYIMMSEIQTRLEEKVASMVASGKMTQDTADGVLTKTKVIVARKFNQINQEEQCEMVDETPNSIDWDEWWTYYQDREADEIRCAMNSDYDLAVIKGRANAEFDTIDAERDEEGQLKKGDGHLTMKEVTAACKAFTDTLSPDQLATSFNDGQPITSEDAAAKIATRNMNMADTDRTNNWVEGEQVVDRDEWWSYYRIREYRTVQPVEDKVLATFREAADKEFCEIDTDCSGTITRCEVRDRFYKVCAEKECQFAAAVNCCKAWLETWSSFQDCCKDLTAKDIEQFLDVADNIEAACKK